MMDADARKIYEKLTDIAKIRRTIFYSGIAPLVGLDMRSSNHRGRLSAMLDSISRFEHEAGRPLLSAVVIDKRAKKPGQGFFEMARRLNLYDRLDDSLFAREELQRVHDYWSQTDTQQS